MVNNLTYFEAHKRASSFLGEKGKDQEALLFVFLEQLKWDKTQWLLNMKNPIPKKHQELLAKDVKLLLEDHPPQYILGYADFLEERFKVTPATLIPRWETEELVMLVKEKEADNNNQPLKVVDIGTGSGVIAISLKRFFPNWNILGVDISKEALTVAKENAAKQKIAVDFKESNVLKNTEGLFDMIISNPPYIADDEKSQMDASVLKYEPQQALFANHQGLEIYERIAEEAQEKLAPNGRIYLEIGYLQKEAVERIFKEAFPQKKVTTFKDLAGQNRMVMVAD